MNKIELRIRHILSPGSKLMECLSIIGDYLLLSVLWVVTSLPVVTIGVSSAALCQVSFRLLRGEEDGCIRSYFRAFRENFSLATRLWLAALPVGLFLVMDLYFYLLWSEAASWIGTILFSFFAAATVLYLCVMLYLFAYVAQFRCGFGTAIRNTAYLSLRHVPYTLFMMAVNVLLTSLCFLFSVLLIALPGMVAFVDCLCLQRVFRRYLPKEAPVPMDG